MSTSSPNSGEDWIVREALELAPAERAAFLDSACAGKRNLRDRVEERIRAIESTDGTAHESAHTCSRCGAAIPADTPHGLCAKCGFIAAVFQAHPGATAGPVGEGPGDWIDQYLLLEKLGEGGFGVVYVAEQREPLKRRVALKIIKLGMDTRQVVARFEAERQALALMDHPNIAKVLDAGATRAGRPYFVMELVHGISITKYCDEHHLATEKRLELFNQTCHAIAHAHQRGIIHRDIKPSNILVCLQDGEPVVKVIDFGIAKATAGQQLTDKTVFTAIEQFVGTPAYVSPEQAVTSGLDVDPRTDIYSLGVLLYELLVGETPLDTRILFQSGLEEIRRVIREQEPRTPSGRITNMPQEQRTTVAKKRGTDPQRLMGLLRSDLDWIVMKALQKDRTQRYASAGEFAQDIRQYLAHERVSATAPSKVYKFRRFMRRNWSIVGVSAAVAALLIALGYSLFLLFKEFESRAVGRITIKSDPSGAEVWHGGQRAGNTPFELSIRHPGEFAYTLVLSNYEAVSLTNYPAPGKQLTDFSFLRPVEMASTAVAPNVKTNFTKMTGFASQGVIIQALEGEIQVLRRGARGWVAGQTNLMLSAGDRLRTGRRCRAILRWSDASIVQLDELTEMEIASPMPDNLSLDNGTIQIFGTNKKTNTIHVITRAGVAGIRG